jgi:hypothetical protein
METLRSNRIGIPSAFKDTKAFSRMPQGTLDWWMHESRSMSSVLWKDKKPVPLFSASVISSMCAGKYGASMEWGYA